jgi:uncharacterized membrane protein HdeD (DUF308 family)/alpha-beta hydrolase superfamily lysophospholipase
MAVARSARWSRTPRWLGLMLAAICVFVGAILVTRPFQSLTVLIILVAAGLILTALSDLADRFDLAGSRLQTFSGVGRLLLGVTVLLWPGLSLEALTLIVGIALIGSGSLRALSALRGESDARAAALLLGTSSIILGIVALFWPDITLLVVAVIFGVQLVCFGLTRLWSAFQRPRPDGGTEPPGPLSPLRRFVQTAGAAGALLAALGLAVISVRINQGAPVVDGFYKAPEQIPAMPGVLLRTEPMRRAIPDGAQAWRILYTTTRDEGVPALASALVVAPVSPPPGPRPVIAWAHGTTGVNETCAPSVLADPFSAGAAPALDQVIANGWVMVATDYIGLGTAGPHAYLIGSEAGRAVLDAVRAARQMLELSLDNEIVVWGHSQGGGGALWTGILAPSYAPEANIVGVAALSPASDLPGMVANLDVVTAGAIFAAYVIEGYSATYADVRFDDYVRPTARILAREMASRCLAEAGVLVSIVESLVIDKSIWATDPASGPLGERLRENVPGGPIQAPLLIGQGLEDPLVLPAAQQAYVQARCQAGGQVDYRTYQGFEHVDIVQPGSPLVPELVTWTQERFERKPARSTC